MNSNKLKMQQN